MAIILCLLLLQLKHFLADFCFQTPAMLGAKGQYGAIGGGLHAVLHGIGTTIALLFFAPVPIALAFGAGDAIVHYHIDWAKVRFQGNAKPHDHIFWVQLGFDQFLHQLTMLGIVYVVFVMLA